MSTLVLEVEKITATNEKENTATVKVNGIDFCFKGKGAHGSADKQASMVVKSNLPADHYIMTIEESNGQAGTEDDRVQYAGNAEAAPAPSQDREEVKQALKKVV